MKTKKILALALAAVLLMAVTVAGTVAYLQDRTPEITNTFTTSNIDIKIAESENLDLKMVPGKVLTKDPTVTVIAGSEACWLFVKVVESEDFDNYMEYTMADGWTELEAGVYYREVPDVTADTHYAVIKNNQVTVKTGITNEQMDDLKDNEPTLTVSAFAIQKLTFANAGAAWTEVQKLTDAEDHYATESEIPTT